MQQRLHELLGLVMEEEGAVEKVHADDAERLLLQCGLHIQHADMNDDLAGLISRMRLELHAHPAVALVRALEISRGHRVGKGEEGGGITPALAQAIDVQPELVVEHALEPLAAHVARGLAVDRIAHRHVVGRDALGNRARTTADAEKPANDLLPCADLRKRAVAPVVEIDLESFAVGIESFGGIGGGIHAGRRHCSRRGAKVRQIIRMAR